MITVDRLHGALKKIMFLSTAGNLFFPGVFFLVHVELIWVHHDKPTDAVVFIWFVYIVCLST